MTKAKAKTQAKTAGAGFRPPAHPDRPIHQAARKRVRALSASQLRQTFVKTGINRPDGSLTKRYGG